MTTLIPTSQWVYALYVVRYWADDTYKQQIGEERYIVQAWENHLEAEIIDRWPCEAAKCYSWDVVKDPVPKPRVVGQLYGINLHESGWAAADRMIQKDPSLKESWKSSEK